MRSALFIHNDVNLINRIKITVHDDNAVYFYAESMDEVISIMSDNEISVIVMPYNFDVLDGKEMIEIILDYNPKAQIIVLFDDSDLLNVVKAHNEYHLCQIICDDFFKIEDLQSFLEIGFRAYNKEEDIKAFELSYRQKEDKYKKTFSNISSILNERTDSFLMIRNVLKFTLSSVLSTANDSLKEALTIYVDNLLDRYIQLFLIDQTDYSKFVEIIESECIDNDSNRYFKLDKDILFKINDINRDAFLKLLFVSYVITVFLKQFYSKYRAKIEISETDDYYSVNIVYEAIVKNEFNAEISCIVNLIDSILSVFSDKSVFGTKENISQFRLMYKI